MTIISSTFKDDDLNLICAVESSLKETLYFYEVNDYQHKKAIIKGIVNTNQRLLIDALSVIQNRNIDYIGERLAINNLTVFLDGDFVNYYKNQLHEYVKIMPNISWFLIHFI